MVPLNDIAVQEKLESLLAISEPAWLWDGDQGRILWANRAGAAFWGEIDLVRLTERQFDRAMPGIARIRELVHGDLLDTQARENLVFWTNGTTREITCGVEALTLDEGQRAVLVIGYLEAEPSGNAAANGGPDAIPPREDAYSEKDLSSEKDSSDTVPAKGSSQVRQRRAHYSPQLDDQDRTTLKEIAALVRDRSQLQPDDLTEPRPAANFFPQSPTNSGNGHYLDQGSQSLFETLPIGIAICRDHDMIYANTILAYAFGYESPRTLLDAGGLSALFPAGGLFDQNGREENLAPFRTKTLAARSQSGRQHTVCVLLGDTLFDPKPVQMILILPLSWNDAWQNADKPGVYQADDAAEHLTDGLLTLDRDGLLLSANLQASALLEILLNEFVGKSITELFQKTDEAKIARALHRLEGRAPTLGQPEIIETWTRNTTSPVGPIVLRLGKIPNDESGQYWASLLDLRQLHVTESGSQRAAAAPQPDAGKREADLLAKISHEVRTPLNSIIGFAEIMKDERFGPVGHAKYKGYLNDIFESAHHALSLINDLLDISKLHAGAFEVTLSPIDVNRTIEQCIRTLGPQAEQKRIVMRSSLAAGLPPLLADERCLKQILLNLISNGIKFTDAGGHVIVRTSGNRDDGLKIRVRDTGIGMSDDEIKQAMQPFLQLDIAPRQQIGSGLGLPLAKALAESNGASFSIESTPGGGTQVDLDFPASRLMVDDANSNET